MIYNNDMKAAVRKIRVPRIGDRPFIVDIFEFNDPDFLMIRFYSNQWDKTTEVERGRCAEYLLNVQRTINAFGVDATLDPVIGGPA